MPTRTGIATAIFGVLGLLAGRIFGIFELYIVAAAMLALVACAVAWVLLNWRSLRVSRSVNPARLHVGGTSVVTLSLGNERLIPTPVAQVTDEVQGTPRADAHVPPLRRGHVTRASYRVPAERRGLIALGPMQTRVTDPFALATTIRTSAPDASVLVLPRYDVIAAPPQPSGATAPRPDRSPGRIAPSGDEFSALRPYVVGDDLRKVHWPSTARTGDLVVRTEHQPEHGDSMVLLDVRQSKADPEAFERMISAATSVLMACFERGDSLRFKTTAGADFTADDRAGFDRVLDHLAVAAQVPTEEVRIATDAVGRTESAVLILGSDDSFVAALGPRQALPTATLVVRFFSEGARSLRSASGVASRRMVSIGPRDDFPAQWAELAGPVGPRA